MSMAPPENFILDLSLSTGPAFIGAFLAMGLWGMTCMQTLMYFLTYQSDTWYIKSLVIVLWLLDTAHEILCIQALWESAIPHFGDILLISKIPPNLAYQAIVGCVVAFLARAFFIWRIWKFADKHWIFPLILMPLTLGDTVTTFVLALKIAGKPASYLMTPVIKTLALVPLIIVGIIDTMIAVTMVVLLWRRRTGIPDTDKMLVRLMQSSVNTGAWTAIFGLLSAITFAAWPDHQLTFLTQFPLCPLYCNSVLANLNSRNYIKDTYTVGNVVGRGPPTTSQSMEFDALSLDDLRTSRRRSTPVLNNNDETLQPRKARRTKAEI